jgi:hypothetical protein
MEEIALFTKTFHKKFKPRFKGKFTKTYNKWKPERFCYGCGSKDRFVYECPYPRKRGAKDKSKDRKRKIYFKSDYKEKPSWVCPIASTPPMMKITRMPWNGRYGYCFFKLTSRKHSTDKGFIIKFNASKNFID